MPQLPEGSRWPDMSSDEIFAQMHERFTFAQQFMNTLPGPTFNRKPRDEQRVSIHLRYAVNPYTCNSNFIGDQTCANNAKSAYLRCAVNPCGPCEGCKDYQPGVGGGGGAL